MKKILLTLTLAFTLGFANAQYDASYITVSHEDTSLTVDLYFINSTAFNWTNWFNDPANELWVVWGSYTTDSWQSTSGLTIVNTPTLSTTTGDTVLHLFMTYDASIGSPTNLNLGIECIEVYRKLNGQTIKQDNLGCLQFYVPSNYNFKPCYATVGPISNTPTVFWENDHTANISHYNIKRGGTIIATVNYDSGADMLSYEDITNTQSANTTQEYYIESVDSVGYGFESNVTTIHASTLVATNSQLVIQWSVPITAAPISSYSIYEMDVNGSLYLNTTVNAISNATTMSYTVTNPSPNRSYLIGIENIDCTGTTQKSLTDGILLSNKISLQTAGIKTINIDQNDSIIGYYDLMGREIKNITKGQIIITRYESGKVIKSIY